MNSYRYLLFDADNTLFDFEQASRWAFTQVCLANALPDTQENYRCYRRHNDDAWGAFERREVTKSQLLRLRFVSFLAELGIAADPDACNRVMLDSLAQCVFLVEGAQTLLATLSKTHPIYLVTNAVAAVQRSRLARSPLAPYITEAFISEEAGASKPDTAYFDYVFSRIPGITRDQALVIGDSPSSDLLGANRYGIPCVWFNRLGAALPDGIRADYEISRLEQLYPILGLS